MNALSKIGQDWSRLVKIGQDWSAQPRLAGFGL